MIKQFTFTFFSLMLVAGSFAQSGFQMKIQHMPEALTWGVYLRTEGITPSDNVVTASGQVTVVMPADFVWTDHFNVSGKWSANATVVSPIENVVRKYVSFGLIQAEPNWPIPYDQEEDILLFTFKGETALIRSSSSTATRPT